MGELKQPQINKYISCKSILSDNKAQTTTEYILFIIILFIASYGMIKLFILLWKCKFILLGYGREVINVFI
ncbi:MAG: hypothetical protein PHR82_05805 [Endomicrobiaceae bacterium]|nr:hypothetical protein [Endomicrobiaceae bacterium]